MCVATPSERLAWYALIAFIDVIHSAFEAVLHCITANDENSKATCVFIAIRVAICLLLNVCSVYLCWVVSDLVLQQLRTNPII